MPSSYTLGNHFETFVANLVRSGRYASASEALRDGLRLLEDRETRRSALQKAIADGLNSGPPEAWSVEGIKQAGRRVVAASRGEGIDA